MWRNSWSNGDQRNAQALAEALEQYSLGFNIVSITSNDDRVPSTDLQPFVSKKRLTTQQRRKYRTPPLDTNCIVQFAPSPQGTAHIRSIKGGRLALDTFLPTEPQPLQAQPGSLPTSSTRMTPIKRSSSAQARTRTKTSAPTPKLSPRQGSCPEGPHHPPRTSRHVAHNPTSSTQSRKRGTRTRIPCPGPTSTPPESHPHPHGTSWEEI